ncbi:MAG: DUF1028 domain-containing protein [Candidatus Dormiibacterota bacterium]
MVGDQARTGVGQASSTGSHAAQSGPSLGGRSIATFSIVAADGTDWGVAVASKFLAVGSAVPDARAEVGALATQALANTTYREKGLALLSSGCSAGEVVRRLTEADPGRDHRQLGVVDSRGGAATYTGSRCSDWAGGRVGKACACQGNILAGPQVVDAMLGAFESAAGQLVDRLFFSLCEGDRKGGDRRGRQSAALFVARRNGSYGGLDDRMVDLRVDDHADPVEELARLLALWKEHYLHRRGAQSQEAQAPTEAKPR